MLELFLIGVSLCCLASTFIWIGRANKLIDLNCQKINRDSELICKITSKLAREDSLVECCEKILDRSAKNSALIMQDLQYILEYHKKTAENMCSKDDLKKFEVDLENLIELRKRFKDDRFKNMREAFGGKPNEENS